MSSSVLDTVATALHQLGNTGLSGVAHAWGRCSSQAEVVAALLAALRRRLVPKMLTPEAFDSPAWGAHLHRWGAAFPCEGGLPLGDAVAPASRCVWMGDYVGDSPSGRVEDAAVSGLAAAEALLSHALTPRL